jgi:periplasmic copper chaperone A
VIRKAAAGVAAVAAVVGLWSSAASAHVTINTLGPVTQRSFAKIGFSVPNERDDAGTVKLSVQLPTDQPLAFVSVQPVPGWDITTTTRQLDQPLEGEGSSISEVVDTITWTATGDTQIAPGQFELFWISAGQMPTGVDELAFPAIQTYSSGDEVAWIETGADAEHPAPTVELVAADASSTATTVPAAGGSDDSSNGLAIVALIVGGVGLVAAIAALVLARRSPRPA